MEEHKVILFCVYHKSFHETKPDSNIFYFGVNEIYEKHKDRDNIILEYELEKYNPFLQKRGYMETSAYLHVYWNNLYKDKEMIGFYQYDMKVNTNLNYLEKDTIYLLNSGRKIVENNKWNHFMFPQYRNLNFLINSYNKHFSKDYSINSLENLPLTLWQTNIYPIKIYEKLCKWLEVLVEDIYPWSNQPPYETHFGSIGGYTERALGIFNAFEIYEGTKYSNLEIMSIKNNTEIVKEQYNIESFLNNYSQDIHAKFIENITGDYDDANYSMFKAQCYLNGIFYTCERINKNGKNGLYFKRTCDNKHTECAFDIEGEDPRIFTLNENVYVVFICISPYMNQKRCIGISSFDKWNPVFLQVENMNKNDIEKNWAPFVKDNKLYFVYNYDPLVILHYDFNPNGICTVVFKQNNCILPINTSTTYLRGGSNLIHYKDEYYIGGCHSRILKESFEHYTHIILLNTNTWELVYVSKPVMYIYKIKDKLNAFWVYPGYKKQMDTFNNILVDKTPHIIQDPISLYIKDEKFYMSINVRDCVSLLYELSFSNLFDFIKTNNNVGYYDNYIKDTIIKI
jgi:hypothetical protein